MIFYCSSPGISRKRDVQLSSQDFKRGTFTFRAPEVEYFEYLDTNGHKPTVPTLTPQVDMYAFAMIMYILLYGNRLWCLGSTKTQLSKRGLVADKKCNRPPLGDPTVLGGEAPDFSPRETIENWKISSALENYAMKRDDRCQYKAWNGHEWVADPTATASTSVDYKTPHTEDYIKLM
jgi:hypothetical protein